MCVLCQDGNIARLHKKGFISDHAGAAGDFEFGFVPLGGFYFLAKPSFTTEEAVTQLQTSWGGAYEGTTRHWTTGTVTYHIATGPTSPDDFGVRESDGMRDSAGYNAAMMTPFKAGMARASFEMWDDLIAISLTETSDLGADITMAYSSTTELNDSGGRGTYAAPDVSGAGPDYAIESQAIWLATSWASLDEDSDFFFGSRGFATYIHEVGHTLGLSHPSTYDASTGSPTYFANAEYVQDTRQYTVMSYFGGWQDVDGDRVWHFTTDLNYDFAVRYAATPMLHDIAAIQDLYGVDTHTREGHTTYGFNSTAGLNVFDFTINRMPILTIWDAAGIDKLDASGWTFLCDQVINLNPGTFSSVGRLVENVAIAFDCWIENAEGGSGNDTIIGNSLSNTLIGGAGVDTISGGEGHDTLDGGTGADIMRGDRGNDVYVVDTLADTVIETVGGGTDKVIVKVTGYTLAASVENGDVGVATGLTLGGNDLANTLTGNVGDDFLFGNGLSDTLNGGMGNDHLYGGTGADIMRGGFGNDNYYVDLLTDQVIEIVLEGTDTVNVTVNNYVLPTNVENGFINSAAGLTLSGNSGNNLLTGNIGMDTLNGGLGLDELHGGGNGDRLNGGAGKDVLFGEAGMDTFVFRRGEANLDTLMDFDGAGALGGDRIEFQGYGAGSTFFALDATHWLVNSADGLVHETITLANAAAVHWSDFAFIG